MTKPANNITELIGKTPLVKINKLAAGLKARVMAKVESFNPLSSIKDRTAISMIRDAEKKGLIKDETVIVEATSGNTGIALAYICALKGYRLVLAMPETVDVERRRLLGTFAVEILLTPANEGMAGAIKGARETAEKYKESIFLNQCENPANPEAHRRTTGPEIWEDAGGRVDILVAGVGTGGTITGTAEFLKEKNPGIEVVAVEPANSAVLSGGSPGEHKIQGIGAGFIPHILKRELIDRVAVVTDGEARLTALRLAREEGILAGMSSGAALFAALKEAKEEKNAGKTIIVILPDTGERYNLTCERT
ncbi:MAG: cysteine synthase A [Candidatus Omnitrophica bacterium]|nr:cysteine synthase A [Candidatus Omnitrophota bacterium]